MKGLGENLGTDLTVNPAAKQQRSESYAEERVAEAAGVSDRLASEPAAKQVTDAQTIQDLLGEYRQTYATSILQLNQQINEGAKISQSSLQANEQRDARVYEALVALRLSAPPEAQASVLQAIGTLQSRIAVVED